jgi:hypothetical protein
VRGTDFEGSAFYLQGLTFGQGQGNLAAGPDEDALKGGTGDIHAGGSLCLGQAFKVGQTQGFQLLLEENNAAQAVERQTGRLVDGRSRHPLKDAPLAGTGHRG